MERALAGHRYRILETLGVGGCGETLRALDTIGGEEVILKRARTAEEAELLGAEFSRVASLDHPGVARALDFVAGRSGEETFIVFERVTGRPSSLAREGAGAAEILGWLRSVSETLDFLHACGLVHGDLKPEHVFVDEDQRVRLIDFGLAGPPGSGRGGTASTVAPEVIDSGAGDERSDLFSLGSTLYYWLFGRFPWGTSLEARLASRRRRPPLPRRDDLPAGCRRLIRDLLAPDPTARVRDTRELLARLEEIGVAPTLAPISDPAARAPSLPPIGRDAALRALAPSWQVGPGPARFLAITGPEGSGRKRLLREVARRAQAAGRRVLVAGEGDLALSRQLPVRIHAMLEKGTPLTLLASTVGDLPPEGLSLLADLPRRLRNLEDLVVVSAGSRVPGRDWTPLPLEPLTTDGVRELASRLLPGPPIAEALAARLAEASGGRPGRLVALLGEAARQGAVRFGPHGWDLKALETKRLTEFLPRQASLPASLAGEHRVVTLALLTASAPLTVHALARASRVPPSSVAEAARVLVAAELADRDPEGRLRASLRAVQLQGTDADERERWHRRWLELCGRHPPAGAAARRVVWLERLVLHAAGGGRPVLAARLAVRGVRQAVRAGRPDLASAILAELGDRGALPAALRARLLESEGEIHLASARPGDAEAVLDQAAALFAELGDGRSARRAAARRARALGDLGRSDEALSMLEDAEAEAHTPENRARIAVEKGVLLARRQEYESALRCLDRALELAPAGAHVEARARAARARCLVLLHRLDEAEQELILAREPARRAGDRSLEAALMLAEGQAALAAGHPRRLLDRSGVVRRALLSRGEADGLGMLEALISDAESMLGNLDGALEAATNSLRWRELHGHRAWTSVSWNRLARLHLLRGSLEGARTATRRARELADEASFPSAAVEAQALLARVQLLEDRPAEALRTARAAVTAAERCGRELPLIEALVARALVIRAQGLTEGAAEDAGRALTVGAPERPRSASEVEALALSAEVLVDSDVDEAMARSRRAARLAERGGFFDAGILAAQVQERALRAAGEQAEALAMRRWARARIEEAAGRFAERSARRTFLERPDRLALFERAGSREGRRLEALYEIVAALNSLHDSGRVAETLMDRALELLGAERGAVVLGDEGGELEVVVCRGVEEETAADALQLSRTILRRARTGESVLTLSPAEDPRFEKAQSVRMFGIRAVLCVPLRCRGRLVGAIYVDSREPARRFDREDLRFLEALSDHAGLALENARAFTRLEHENERLREDLGQRDRLGDLLGRSPAMLETFRAIESYASTDLPVLVTGESGSGKELVARAVHRRGARPEGPFVPVNCAAIPEEIFESTLFGHEKGAFTSADRARAGLVARAQGGTLFLDEIAELPLALQAKLLRVLEERRVQPLGATESYPVDFRVVAATNHDLPEATRAGSFRQDLLYRVDVLRIEVPPLRERLEDLPLLVEHLLGRLSESFGPLRLSPAVLTALAGWSWPGNVRELENTLARLALHARDGLIDSAALAHDPQTARTFAVAPAGSSRTQLDQVERDTIRRALELCGGHRERTIEMLGISRATLFRKMKRYGLEDVGRTGRPRPGPRVSN